MHSDQYPNQYNPPNKQYKTKPLKTAVLNLPIFIAYRTVKLAFAFIHQKEKTKNFILMCHSFIVIWQPKPKHTFKIKRFFTAMPYKNHFWFHKPFSQRFFKDPSLSFLFIIWRTFFHHKEPFVKQKGSSDVKGSLWNHLDKNVLREAPLFLRVHSLQLTKKKKNDLEENNMIIFMYLNRFSNFLKKKSLLWC